MWKYSLKIWPKAPETIDPPLAKGTMHWMGVKVGRIHSQSRGVTDYFGQLFFFCMVPYD